MKISFMMYTSPRFPGGGPKVIYEYANFLAERGHDVTIYFMGNEILSNRGLPEKVRRFLAKKIVAVRPSWFSLNSLITKRTIFSVNNSTVDDADIIIATDVRTVEPVYELDNKNRNSDEHKLRNRIIFFVIAEIACTFHFEAFFFVVVFVMVEFFPDKINRISVLGFTVGALLLVLSGFLPKLLMPLNARIAYWLSTDTGFGFLKKCGKFSDYMFLLIPLFCYDITFNRMWRIFLLIMYVVLGDSLYYKLSDNSRRLLVFFNDNIINYFGCV